MPGGSYEVDLPGGGKGLLFYYYEGEFKAGKRKCDTRFGGQVDY